LFLESKFEMTDMGEASVTLGLKVIRKGDSILLSQEQYTKKLLRKFDYYDFKSVSTPYDANSKLKQRRIHFSISACPNNWECIAFNEFF